MDPGIVIGLIALLGTLITAIAGYAQYSKTANQASKFQEKSEAAAELSFALSNQRERLQTIHSEYRHEIDAILYRHKAELGDLKLEMEKVKTHHTQCVSDLADLRSRYDEVRAELTELKEHDL